MTKQLITVTGADVSLFHVAAAYLGDATQWVRIAALNDITDPMINGVVSLLIPDVDETAGGGLPPQ